MIYLDTSVVIAAITREDRTDAIQEWLTVRPPGSLCVSDWLFTEVTSALSLKVRLGLLKEGTAARLVREWPDALASSATHVAIDRVIFERATVISGRPDYDIRATDALHIAAAEQYRCSVATLDKKMIATAGHLGLVVETL
jgi:uncharacterized protein